jgi:hypothetical protein
MPIYNGLKLSLLGSYQIEKVYSPVVGDCGTSMESMGFSPLELDFVMGLSRVTFFNFPHLTERACNLTLPLPHHNHMVSGMV